MPTLRDVKQHLREWEHAHRQVFLIFREHIQFEFSCGGEIRCGRNCRSFDVVDVVGNNRFRFFSPPLSAFRVVALGPDPNFGNRTTVKLRHRGRRRWQMTLIDTETEQLTPEEIVAISEEFIASQKPTKRKTYVQ